tara:strand:+ start:6457 stop:6723 length:267 start_codon:yes stop_codon:yes gene_type:complete
MGCNCTKDAKEIVRLRRLHSIHNKFKTKQMAKFTYKGVDGLKEDARLNFNGDKYVLKNIPQATLKLMYDAGHPSIDRIETTSEKKDKK